MTLEAARKLTAHGISADVLNVHTIKPIDEQTLIKSLEKTGRGIVIEEHNIYGGLGSVVATVLSQEFPCRLDFLCTNDDFGDTGTPDDLLTSFGLRPEHIVRKAAAMLRNRLARRRVRQLRAV
ncbi:MAG: hypothetical protein HY000_10105 [Planctomycetes bacterium]|nr:hypothetical protein [Planctomycetota bacterium]